MSARKREHKSAAEESPDPEGTPALTRRYLEWLGVHNYSHHTINAARLILKSFAAYLSERGVSRPAEVTRALLERYQRSLFHHRTENGRPLSFQSQRHRLAHVRGFFRYLTRQNILLYNPSSELEMPRAEKPLPRALNVSEAEAVLSNVDLTRARGVRDRAILETLYSTGMRRTELSGLKLSDLDRSRGVILIRFGKGKKDRMVPVGERALQWIEKYLTEVRSTLSTEPDDGSLFLGRLGEPLSPNTLTRIASRAVKAAGLDKSGACHLFRHTAATLMLEGGADVRFIQQMLGHADLSTTALYTKVSIHKLKDVHDATHPGARLRRQKPRSNEREPNED